MRSECHGVTKQRPDDGEIYCGSKMTKGVRVLGSGDDSSSSSNEQFHEIAFVPDDEQTARSPPMRNSRSNHFARRRRTEFPTAYQAFKAIQDLGTFGVDLPFLRKYLCT